MHWLETVQGLPGAPALRELLRPYADGEAFVCGPAPFMDGVSRALGELEVPRSRIHLDRFVSLTGDPWSAPVEVVEEGGAATTVSVDLDGAQHAVTWPPSRVLLDALLDAGLDAPYSCRQGNCSACACKLVEGEVKMRANNVLEAEDLDEGWILACQSVPLTPSVSVTYDD
ncbi:MAG: hypothetical protein NVS3B26_27650 [Mycobacteriales bacterium]